MFATLQEALWGHSVLRLLRARQWGIAGGLGIGIFERVGACNALSWYDDG